MSCCCARVCASRRRPSTAPANRKQATATRVPNGSIRVDGRLDDEAWQKATPITDFIQKEPVEGAAPTDAMDVRHRCMTMTCCTSARGCSARTAASRRRSAGATAPIRPSTSSSRSTPSSIAAPPWSSASPPPACASIAITRATRRTRFDSGFDPVWRAETSVSGDQWTAELWIPFSQLRFNPRTELTWGLNLYRFRPTLDEADYWILIPRTVRAWSSRFGDCQRHQRRRAAAPHRGAAVRRRRIDLQRRSRSQQSVRRRQEPRGPRRRRRQDGAWARTSRSRPRINPDFGQVEADPAEVNLTAFETRFPEKRPFFLEGAQLFNIGHPNFYYSRRIGARPIGPATGDYVEYPEPEHDHRRRQADRPAAVEDVARLHRRRDRRRRGADRHAGGSPIARTVKVSPHAYHFVGRMLQEFGPSASTAGLHRQLRASRFRGGQSRSPISTRAMRSRVGGNTLLRFKGGQYEFRASGGGSFLNGEREGRRALAAIELALRAAARSRLLAARSDADVDGRLVGADELRQDRRPPLAVGRQHQDRFRELRGQRLRAVERRRRHG